MSTLLSLKPKSGQRNLILTLLKQVIKPDKYDIDMMIQDFNMDRYEFLIEIGRSILCVMIKQRGQCYKDYKLRKRIKVKTLRILKCFHLLFHLYIVAKPHNPYQYLELMSIFLSFYIDLELITTSTRTLAVSKRVEKNLILFLGKHNTYIIDAILNAKLFILKYRESCAHILKVVLARSLTVITSEKDYIQLILSYTLWKRMELGKRNKTKILNLATEKVVFSDVLIRKYLNKESLLHRIFPFLTTYNKNNNKYNITTILMKSAFDFKEKVQLYCGVFGKMTWGATTLPHGFSPEKALKKYFKKERDGNLHFIKEEFEETNISKQDFTIENNEEALSDQNINSLQHSTLNSDNNHDSILTLHFHYLELYVQQENCYNILSMRRGLEENRFSELFDEKYNKVKILIQIPNQSFKCIQCESILFHRLSILNMVYEYNLSVSSNFKINKISWKLPKIPIFESNLSSHKDYITYQ